MRKFKFFAALLAMTQIAVAEPYAEVIDEQLVEEIQQQWEKTKFANCGPKLLKAMNNVSPTCGNVTGLVVLVDFPLMDNDGNITNTIRNAMIPTVTRDYMDDMYNADFFTNSCCNSSIRKYYLDQSFGKLDYRNIVLGWYLAPHKKEYYDNSSNTVQNAVGKLIDDIFPQIRASADYQGKIVPQLKMLTATPASWCHNGTQRTITSFNIIYAGYNNSSFNTGLWSAASKCSTLQSYFPLLDGTTNSTYRFYVTNITKHDYIIGVICHEAGHMLCDFPDLYDYTFKSYGLGYYSLMAKGDTGGNPPVEIDPYLCECMGWTTPTILKPGIEYDLCLANRRDCVYKYSNPTNANEYYLIYNRQKGIYGTWSWKVESGIVILRCNKNMKNTYPSSPRGSAKANLDPYMKIYECIPEQANGEYYLERGMTAGIYSQGATINPTNFQWFAENSSTNFHNVFSDLSLPTAKWIEGCDSEVRIWNFSKTNNLMTCKFMSTYGLKKCKYTGKAIEPPVTVMFRGHQLTYGVHYTVEYSKNVEIGIGNVRIQGIGMFYGYKDIKFAIVENAVEDYKTLNAEL